MILHHATPFGRAERSERSIARATAARARVAAWLSGDGAHHPRPAGLVLTGPAAVAWLCGGIAPPVDRTAATDLVWAVVTTSAAALITTNVEAGRIAAEYDPAAHGFADLAEVAWYRPDDFVTAAAEIAGVPPERLASDGHPAFGIDASEDLTALRLALSPGERADLAALGTDAARALQDALTLWRPGERDLDIQARCAAALEEAGADTPVLIVGGDDRLAAYRHPMAVGAPVSRLAMAVVVARRAGLHVAATRFAAAGPLDPEYAALRDRVLAIEDAVLSSCRPGNTYGTALDSLGAAYDRAGLRRGWTGHYQGGPIGFAQREFEIAPQDTGSRWYREPIAAGHAVAWNPSLPGGAKAEDTYLVSDDGGLSRVTDAPGWPAESNDNRRPGRPAVLEVGT
ncbi:MAG: M24 family metallopeptidase [Streptosporangiaceae bacterium]